MWKILSNQSKEINKLLNAFFSLKNGRKKTKKKKKKKKKKKINA